MQTIAALIAINANINAVINAIAIKPPGKNLAIKIIFYINPTGENPKLIIKPKQKSINIATIIAIRKTELKQKPTDIGTAITN